MREVQVEVEPVQVPVKEMTIAEKEALFAAKKKADAFYRDYEDYKKNASNDFLEGHKNTMKANPNHSTWKDDILSNIKKDLEERRDILFDIGQSMFVSEEDYEYLINVFPELIREKTSESQAKVKQDLQKFKEIHDTEYEECLSYLSTIRQELKRRSEISEKQYIEQKARFDVEYERQFGPRK